MTQTSAEQMRGWRGPAVLSFGFRTMFLSAALWAVLAMVLWIAMLAGVIDVPTRFDLVAWHAHEFLFGYLGAVIAGFLLTAVPNWTGRLPVVGWNLAGLAALWLIGRIAVFASVYLPVWVVACFDLAFLMVLCAVILREVVAGKSWKNLPVLALVGVLVAANLLFHIEAARGGAANGYGLRLGLSVVLVLVVLIGGKIIPSFTRNWLVKHGVARLPAPPMQRFDKAVLVVTVLVMAMWTAAPDARLTAVALLLMAALHAARLLRWQGVATRSEVLVWVLHVAYGFVPLGALLNALAILAPDVLSQAAALHVWTAGAIGLMTLGVMTRASLGHSGRELHASNATTIAYYALILSVAARVLADIATDLRIILLDASGLFWIIAFGVFVLAYGPMLMTPKPQRQS